MAGIAIVRRIAYLSAGAVAGTAAVYRNDLKQLEFDAVSSLGPGLRLLDAERAHKVGIWAAKTGLFPRETRPDPESLSISVWGKDFSNPVGLAAGFDKDGEAVKGLLSLGFGFVEIGSVTPLPQPGNPKPRCFRLKEYGAVINRYGFNSQGVEKVKENITAARNSLEGKKLGLVGINLGKNKTSEDAVGDYCTGVRELGYLADYLVINISSPNTPGLRALQSRKELETLISAVLQERNSLQITEKGHAPPLLVKIAPDLVQQDLEDIAKVSLKLGVDGLIVSNTTIERPEGIRNHPDAGETGGLSGKPLFSMSTDVLSEMYKLTKGKIPLIGVGGVSSGREAYQKIRAGASLIELYTAFSYAGPSIVPNIKKELAQCLATDGFASVKDAVGADHAKISNKKQKSLFWSRA
eukprot:jgi/Picsp_1/6587/NSC_03930-R1_dihydroorotate dehydrogenase